MTTKQDTGHDDEQNKKHCAIANTWLREQAQPPAAPPQDSPRSPSAFWHDKACQYKGERDQARAAILAVAQDLNKARAQVADLLAALRLFLPLATDAKCIQSVKWTNARDTARVAIARAEKGQS